MIGASAIALAALLTGCSGQTSTFDSVSDLRDALEEAGGECPEYRETGQSKYSSESAYCSPESVIAVYENHADVQAQVELRQRVTGSLLGGEWLVGENWSVDAPDLEFLQAKLGGEIVNLGTN